MYLVISKADRQSSELAKIALSYLRENKLKYDFEKEITAPKKEYELAIAIGDDRFILETFRKLGKSQIPLFAAGSSQSFLAQANALNLKHYLNLIKKKKYTIFKRSRLTARFDKTMTPIALNDIGLFLSKRASLLKYS